MLRGTHKHELHDLLHAGSALNTLLTSYSYSLNMLTLNVFLINILALRVEPCIILTVKPIFC